MEDFLQLQWIYRSVEDSEATQPFVANLDKSCVYQGFQGVSLQQPTKIICVLQKHHVPGLQHVFKEKIKSSLNESQHLSCLRALQTYQSGQTKLTHQEVYDLNIYNKLKPKIIEENYKFLAHVKAKWDTVHSKINAKPKIYWFAYNSWIRKFENVQNYPQIYKQLITIPFSYKDEDVPIDMVFIQNALEVGTLAKFCMPSLKCHLSFKISTLPDLKKNISVPSQLPVSKDNNVDAIVANTEVDVVISSSGLTCLLNFTEPNNIWDIPITVKDVSVPQNNSCVQDTKTRRVIYVDKPLPKKSISVADINYYTHKVMVKTNLCQNEAFSFPNMETPFDSTKIEKKEKNNDDSTEHLNSLLEEKGAKIATKRRVIHHNVSYRLWHLKQKYEECTPLKGNSALKAFKVLVRCKLDACEDSENGALQPISVFPKIENQIEYGASIFTKREMIKQWALLFFRPFSCLYRVRINNRTSEVIAVENCTIQKINSEALHFHECKPNLGLGVLYKIFSELSHLDAGKYLLQHTPKCGPFVTVLKETELDTGPVYNLQNEYVTVNNPVNHDTVWCPIDVNNILPVHIHFKQMPGLFRKTAAMKFKGAKKHVKRKRKNNKKKEQVVKT